MLKCQSHMIAAVARPRERAARAGRAEKRTNSQSSRADPGAAVTALLIYLTTVHTIATGKQFCYRLPPTRLVSSFFCLYFNMIYKVSALQLEFSLNYLSIVPNHV